MDAWRPKDKFLYDLLENIVYAVQMTVMAVAFMAVIIFAI